MRLGVKLTSERSSKISEDNPASEIKVLSVEANGLRNVTQMSETTKNVGCKKVLSQLCNNDYSYLRTMLN